jgi:hypothetical protein
MKKRNVVKIDWEHDLIWYVSEPLAQSFCLFVADCNWWRVTPLKYYTAHRSGRECVKFHEAKKNIRY